MLELTRLLCLFILTIGYSISDAQDFFVNSSQDAISGDCVCHVQVPNTIQCSKVVNSETLLRITDLQSQVSQLSVTVNDQAQIFQTQSETIDTLSGTLAATLDTLERIEAGTLVLSRPELIQIRQELNDMEVLLIALRNNHTSLAVIIDLQAEIVNITTLLDEMETHENADTSSLLQQIQELRVKVEECQNVEVPSSLYDLWEETAGSQDSCGNLLAVSLPYTVTGLRAVYGAWFRDPVKSQRRVYSFEMPNGRYAINVNTYDSLRDYHDNSDVVSIRLSENAQGTGLIAFNGSLYYNVYNTRNVARFELISKQKVTGKALDTAGFNNAMSYRSGAYSDIDLLADELGLWVIYSSTEANGFILVSKLDPDTLDIIQTWRTNYPKTAAGNCFIACGIVYCTNGFDSHINKINYKFDTKTETEEFLNIPFDNKFLKTYSLNYNARDQKLYGWDNGHQMIYDLIFSQA